ncbi:DNA repair protein rad51 [Cordyceps javanica]|uniref:DNA repair protein rad51 n=1 Tax=Cordyceps javanica TaxID=43265 RepID=A0A545V247_9HYPO|nr:DNA repair protein rad51 [Cordyceps javanica]TQW07020.1 DNA repair protein rad51 [Cordyceps javanica]
MDSSDTQLLFKETRLNLEPPAAASIVTIRVPSLSGGSSRSNTKTDGAAEDETAFRRKNLASATSIYHRQHHDTPRNFLWRVLEDGFLLSVRAADVCCHSRAADAPLVLNFHFAVPIQPGCVALADPQEHDALCLFVLDTSSHLYTFTLRPDLFRKRTAVDAGLSDLAKVQAPAGLGFKYPHRMVAVSANTLLVTVNDGGMIRLDRNQADDGGVWKETFFNVQGWKQNLRSLLPFQGNHTIRYGRINMEYSAATAVQVTSLGLDGCLFAITVCLDHRIRIWNIQDGQILFTGDLLGADRSPQEIGKWTLDPSQANLVQLVGRSPGQRICATYSPIGPGEFKFWKIVAKGPHTLTFEDLFPKLTLIPETPSSSDIWTLADFVLTSPEDGSISLWTLWKNNMTYRVQRLELDRTNMSQVWQRGWEGVHSDTNLLTTESSGPWDPQDVTEKWLQLILKPGRFTKATLEVALSIYERGLGKSREGNKGRGLAESICSVLGAAASLERGATGAMDYEQFRSSSESQWRRFYRLLIELDKQRGEAVSLAFDPESDVAWVVCADLVSAIRECSGLERIYHNLSSPEQNRQREAALINTALSFVDGFSDSYLQLCNAALRPELFGQSQKTDLERIQFFSDKAGFWRGITDEDCTQIVDVLGQNFNAVTDDLYNDVLDLLATPTTMRSRRLNNPVTEFGRKLVMAATQDYLTMQWNVCFSQLILLVHMEFEFDNEEDALHHRVDVGNVFRGLIAALRRLELLKSLGRTELSVPLFKPERGISPKKSGDDTQVVTTLEANVGHLLGFSNRDEVLSKSITEIAASLCAVDSDIEVSPALIQCSLIKRQRADLASALAPFCGEDPFSVYVQGRVSLSLKDYTGAANFFRKAAIGMSTENLALDHHSSGLLDDTEWALFNNGLPCYYSHIVALYDSQKAYSYVVEFARLAMQFTSARPSRGSVKAEMLTRQFSAALATCQFELAHTTLLSIQDKALRSSSLRHLVDKMCETSHNSELVALPFPGMQQEVDEFLAKRCRNAVDVVHGAHYHQVLYAWRIKRQNMRGAAWVLLDRIQKLKLAGEADKITGDDVLDTPVTRQYLLLINALSCVDPKQAWVFDEGETGATDEETGLPRKRTVVSLADVRKQYQDELDRIAAIQNNQFGFSADDVMDLA